MAWHMPTSAVAKNEFERPSARTIWTIFLLAIVAMLLYGMIRPTPTLDERVLGRQTSPRLPEPDRRFAGNGTRTQDANSAGIAQATESTVPLKAGVRRTRSTTVDKPAREVGDKSLTPIEPTSDKTGASSQPTTSAIAATTTSSPVTAATPTISRQPLLTTTRPNASPTTSTQLTTTTAKATAAPATNTTLRQLTIIPKQTAAAQVPVPTTRPPTTIAAPTSTAPPPPPSTQPTTTAATPNRPPSARADTAHTNISTTIGINVLANDSDPDKDILRVSAPPTSDHGASITVNGSGTIFYTPNPQAYWLATKDTIMYTVTDSGGETATAQVTVTISPGFIQWSGGDRQNPSTLNRAPRSSGLFVSFFPADSGPVSYVQFRIDGDLVTREQAPFYDLGGSSGLGTADDVQPFSVASLPRGTHEISARTVYNDGRTTSHRQDFSVE